MILVWRNCTCFQSAWWNTLEHFYESSKSGPVFLRVKYPLPRLHQGLSGPHTLPRTQLPSRHTTNLPRLTYVLRFCLPQEKHIMWYCGPMHWKRESKSLIFPRLHATCHSPRLFLLTYSAPGSALKERPTSWSYEIPDWRHKPIFHWFVPVQWPHCLRETTRKIKYK